MARKPPPPPKPSRVTVPSKAHPLAKVVFKEMQRQGVTYDELEYRAGVLRSTFKAWRTDNVPGLASSAAVLGALGWCVLPVPRLEHLPPAVQAGLDALAAQWEREDPLLCQLLATVSKVPIIGEFKRDNANVVAMPAPRKPKRRAIHPDQVALFESANTEEGKAA